MLFLLLLVALVPFAVSFLAAWLSGILLRRLPWSNAVVTVLSFLIGQAALFVFAIIVFLVEPNMGHFILAAGIILLASTGGAALGAYLPLRKRQSNAQTTRAPNESEISPPLVHGIFLLPVVFAWFTLKPRYSKKTKAIAFCWLGIYLISPSIGLVKALRVRAGDTSACETEYSDPQCWAKAAVSSGKIEKCTNYRDKYAAQPEPENCLREVVEIATNTEVCSDILTAFPILSDYADYCFLKFPNDKITQQRCSEAWKSGNEKTITVAECWSEKNVKFQIPNTGHTPLLAYFTVSRLGLSGSGRGGLAKLLALQPDLTARDPEGKSVLHFLRNDGELHSLLEAGANPNLIDNEGLTPPMQWAKSDNLFIFMNHVDQLLKANWKINQVDKDGETILHKIVKARVGSRNRDLSYERKGIEKLISAGADFTIKNANGITCVDIALAKDLRALFSEAQLPKDVERVDPDITALVDAELAFEKELPKGQTLMRLPANHCFNQSGVGLMVIDKKADTILVIRQAERLRRSKLTRRMKTSELDPEITLEIPKSRKPLSFLLLGAQRWRIENPHSTPVTKITVLGSYRTPVQVTGFDQNVVQLPGDAGSVWSCKRGRESSNFSLLAYREKGPFLAYAGSEDADKITIPDVE